MNDNTIHVAGTFTQISPGLFVLGSISWPSFRFPCSCDQRDNIVSVIQVMRFSILGYILSLEISLQIWVQPKWKHHNFLLGCQRQWNLPGIYLVGIQINDGFIALNIKNIFQLKKKMCRVTFFFIIYELKSVYTCIRNNLWRKCGTGYLNDY